ncbi:beta-lactamase family protein [Paracoccaceae bacterium]|nr:beta-lactamase family protein [Paracoccaceae bacterium]
MDQFSKVAKKYLDKGLIAGLEWEIRHFNKVLSKNVEGYSDIENKTILEPGRIYRIYSMTKPIVSVAAIRLIEACKLSLYSNIQDFIPSFKHLKVLRPNGELERLKRPINLADLLTHTSGLSYNFNMGCSVAQFYQQENILNDPNISLEQLVDQIANLPLAFQPGEAWRYSVATDVIGRVLEVVEDKNLSEILGEQILSPLDMKETSFSICGGSAKKIMPMHGNTDVNKLISFQQAPLKIVDAENSHPSQKDLVNLRGGTGLFSTIDDYQLFCNFLLNGKDKNGSPLISKTMHEFMLTNRISDHMLPLRLGPISLSGYGWNLIGRVMTNKGLAMSLTENGEFGWSGAASTYFWIDRENQLTGIIMTQYIGGYITIADDFRARSYSLI